MAYIACFDSGLGGLTTLAALRQELPGEDYLYAADARHTPYGGRPRQEVLALTEDVVQQLLPLGLKALVIACNTATSAAVVELRQKLAIPVLGLEPAVKPALEQSEGRVLVLGTELTVREQKFIRLLKSLPRAQRVLPLACPGLVELIEQETAPAVLKQYLRELLEDQLDGVGALVLGCTHYVYLRPLLAELWPQLPLFDGNQGVSRHLRQVLQEEQLLGGGRGQLRWFCPAATVAEQAAYEEKCRCFYARIVPQEPSNR